MNDEPMTDLSTTPKRDSSRVIIYLGYHKTASKWIWKHFFTENYPHRQVNLTRESASELWDEIDNSSGPFIVRQRLEDGLMGEEVPDFASAEACMHHMVARGHCKLRWEDDVDVDEAPNLSV